MSYQRKNPEDKYEFPVTPGESNPTDGHNPYAGPDQTGRQWSPTDFSWLTKFIIWRRGKAPENTHDVYRDEKVVGEMTSTSTADDVVRAMNDVEHAKLDKERRAHE